MKLIKQNDNAGGLIFKQNQNGKTMKQNYNFGNGFKQTSGITGIIELDGLTDFSIMSWMWFMRHSGGTAQSRSVWLYKDTIFSAPWFRYSDKSRFFLNNWTTTNFQIVGPISSSTTNFQILYYTTFDFINNKWTTGTAYNNYELTDISGLSTALNLPTHLLFDMQSPDMSIASFTVFNRLLTDNEIKFRNNNKLGNELLNQNNIVINLPNNIAEIIDFGGSVGEAVAVRNTVQDKYHMRFQGLPAGTLQEQLDYVNENILVPW